MRNLYLHQNNFTVEGLKAITESETLSGLEVLYLKANILGVEGARILAESPYLRHLKELYLQGAFIGQEGLEAICRSPVLKTIQKLNISYNGLDDRAADVLISTGSFFATVDLYGNQLSQQAAERIRASGIVQKLLYD